MTHEAYDITIGAYTKGLSSYHHKRWKNSGALVSEYTHSGTNYVQNGGTIKRSRLDATHKTVEDKYGWRDPTTYYGGRVSQQKTGVSVDYLFRYGTDWVLWEFRNAGNAGSDTYSVPATPELTANVLSAIDAVKQKALTKFGKISVDLSVAFFERKKTADFVASTVRDIVDIAKDIKKGRFFTGRAGVTSGTRGKRWVTRDFPKRWLEARYAWLPSIYDVYGAVGAIEKADNGTYDRYIVTTRAQQKVELINSVTTDGTLAVYGPHSIGEYKVSTRIADTTVKVRYDAIPEDTLYLRLKDVGVTNPFTTLWELLPYSFVVDWFLGVGDFLQGVNALDGYTFKAGVLTVRQKTKATTTWLPKTQSSTDVSHLISSGPSYLAESDCFTRSLLSEPSSQILLKSSPLSLVHLVDSYTLLSQVFGKKLNFLRV